jgi:D-tagatose-1,6-bisphosphate aldolase subunit GatZ/KbaZ
MNALDLILAAQKSGEPRGIPAVCSAHPYVLQAAFQHGKSHPFPVLLEATCNQVNQFGGYTGMTPADFVSYVKGISAENAFPLERVILGGDHLGPSVWQNESIESAMPKALAMVQAYVRAGFTKIHLDASMKLADDAPGILPVEMIAHRAAQLAKTAEEAAPDASQLRYVIGTEVPVPGGAFGSHEPGGIHITQVDDTQQTIRVTRTAFFRAGLEAAWERVIAVVVQPGVEFGDDYVVEYRPEAAKELRAFIQSEHRLVYEAHSTDYQTRAALQNLVRDHFAILKVGPGLTFAFREAVFALAHMEEEIYHAEDRSHIRHTLEAAALRHPEYWQKYYPGTVEEQAFKRKYSLSDRIRYYWTDPAVQAALSHLLRNLSQKPLPLSLVSQYLPVQYRHIRSGDLPNDAQDILLDRVMDVLKDYTYACSR